MPVSLGPSEEAYAKAEAEFENRSTAEVLADLPAPVLERLTNILRIVGGMSQDEKDAARTLMKAAATIVAVQGAEAEMPAGYLVMGVADLVSLVHRLASGQAVD